MLHARTGLHAHTATFVSLIGTGLCVSGANAALAEVQDAASPFQLTNEVETTLDWVGICQSTRTGSASLDDADTQVAINGYRAFSAPVFEAQEDCSLFGKASKEHEISTRIELPVEPDRGVALLFSLSVRPISGVGMISLNN